MEVVRKRLMQGAREARGTVVVIDVFRAFTCAPILFALGIRKLILERDPERALSLRKDDRTVLVGEIDEKPIPGFDLGNSPFEILRRGRSFFGGKVVVQRTTSGVTGTAEAIRHADSVVLGGYVTAEAIARHILKENPPTVTLLAMGARTTQPAPEDEGCAAYIEHLITGKPYDHLQTLRTILEDEQARKFLDGRAPYLPREDPVICLQNGLFDFVLLAEERDGLLEAVPRAVHAPDGVPLRRIP